MEGKTMTKYKQLDDGKNNMKQKVDCYRMSGDN